jgi:hypothetical protein
MKFIIISNCDCRIMLISSVDILGYLVPAYAEEFLQSLYFSLRKTVFQVSYKLFDLFNNSTL